MTATLKTTTHVVVRGYEIDALGHIAHTVYMQYAEHARWERMAAAGLDGRVKARFCQGDPVTEILLAAEDLDCDLIVMGSHVRTGLRRLLMGSVAEDLCRKAPCLTLIVKDAPGEMSGADQKPSLAGRAGASG